MLCDKRKCLVVIGGVNPGHTRTLDFWEKVLGDLFQIISVNVGCILDIDINRADLLILYTSLEGAIDEEVYEIYRFARTPGKILLVIHEGCIYNKKLTYFKDLIGVRFTRHNEYGIQRIKGCGNHILLNNVTESFVIKDELYILDEGFCNISSNDNVFLKDAINNIIVGYERTTRYKSKIFFISLGHNEKDMLECKELLQIFRNLQVYLL